MTSRLMVYALMIMTMVAGLGAMAQMDSMPMGPKAKTPAVPSTRLTLTIDGKATTLSVVDLQAMPQKTVTAHNEHTKAEETYTGVPLGELLAKYGFAVDQSTHQKMLHSYLRVEGTDKYWVLYSVTEVEPSEHDGEVLVALTMNGKDLGPDGALKLIASRDKKPERWVRNLASITLMTSP